MLIDLFNTYRTEAQHIASVLLALAIWRWGAAPERWLIGVFMVTMVMPLYMFRMLGLGQTAFGPFAWLWIGIDLFAAAAFTVIALQANRNYPLWIAGFQLVAISAHVVRGMGLPAGLCDPLDRAILLPAGADIRRICPPRQARTPLRNLSRLAHPAPAGGPVSHLILRGRILVMLSERPLCAPRAAAW